MRGAEGMCANTGSRIVVLMAKSTRGLSILNHTETGIHVSSSLCSNRFVRKLEARLASVPGRLWGYPQGSSASRAVRATSHAAPSPVLLGHGGQCILVDSQAVAALLPPRTCGKERAESNQCALSQCLPQEGSSQ